MVSPGFGNRSANVVRSMLALPTTATLGRAGIIYLESASERRVYLACLLVSIDIATGRSLTVRNPNIFHLSGVLQEPSAFPLLRVKPVNGAAFVGEYLFQIPHRKRLRRRGARFVRKTPDCIHVSVFGDGFEKL